MPRFSDDTLLTRARNFALLDREALLEAYSGEGPIADDIRSEIEGLNALKGKKLARMSPEEDRMAFIAFVCGEQWEQSLADSGPGRAIEAECRKNVELFREVRLRRWGKTRLESAMENAVAVPVHELLNNATSKFRGDLKNR